MEEEGEEDEEGKWEENPLKEKNPNWYLSTLKLADLNPSVWYPTQTSLLPNHDMHKKEEYSNLFLVAQQFPIIIVSWFQERKKFGFGIINVGSRLSGLL